TDPAGRITALDNAPFGPTASDAEQRAWIAQLDRINEPLVQPGVGTIHYGAVPAARRFTGLAVLQAVVFVCLALLAVWAVRPRSGWSGTSGRACRPSRTRCRSPSFHRASDPRPPAIRC